MSSTRVGNSIATGQVYRHYKGKLYQIIAVARSTEQVTDMYIIYKALYHDPIYGEGCIWARKESEFTSEVREVLLNGIHAPPCKRFTLVCSAVKQD